MTLKDLKYEPGIIEEDLYALPLKPKTVFERKRAACQTYEELVELGYDEGMEFPEAWADYVIQGRRRHNYA